MLNLLRLKRKVLPSQIYPQTAVMKVNPAIIRYRMGAEFPITTHTGTVLSGNWDKDVKLITESDWYQAAEARLRGVPWSETPYYCRILKAGNYGDKTAVDKRCEKWDRLYWDMAKHGYRDNGGRDEINVNIDQFGHLILNNGRHRLAWAKLLGLPKIPVSITVRHEQWAKFRAELEQYAADHKGLYCPVTHIDLQHLPAVHDDERWLMIQGELKAEWTTMLDFGAHWGWFCHKFENLGYQCTAVENAHQHVRILQRLRDAEYRQFAIQPISFTKISRPVADVVLALAIFHHFIKRDRLPELAAFLHRLDCKVMFYQSHSEGEQQMAGSDMTPEGMVKWIIDNSSLQHSRLIGKTKDGRSLYKIWKSI